MRGWCSSWCIGVCRRRGHISTFWSQWHKYIVYKIYFPTHDPLSCLEQWTIDLADLKNRIRPKQFVSSQIWKSVANNNSVVWLEESSPRHYHIKTQFSGVSDVLLHFVSIITLKREESYFLIFPLFFNLKTSFIICENMLQSSKQILKTPLLFCYDVINRAVHCTISLARPALLLWHIQSCTLSVLLCHGL